MMQTVAFPAPPRSDSSRSHDRGGQRKPTPSPLQVSHVSSPIADTFIQTSPRDVDSPTSSRGGSGNSYSPRSLHESPSFDQSTSRTPPERGQVPRSGQSRHMSKDSDTVPGISSKGGGVLTTPRAETQCQLRNVSAPTALVDKNSDSPPHLPSDMPNMKTKSGFSRADVHLLPRQSSLDSTMSSVSSTPSLSMAGLVDSTNQKPEDITQLITNAGSADALIGQLLKEKKQAAAQNTQLFRLVQKQRSLMAGMKADLDHALQEKDIYRKRLREQRPGDTASPLPRASNSVSTLRMESRAESVGSVRSEDELPIQRHSVTDERHPAKGGGTAGAYPVASKTRKDISAKTSLSGLGLNNSISQSSSPGQGSPITSANLSQLQAREDESRRTTMSSIAPIAPLDIHKSIAHDSTLQGNKVSEVPDTVPSPSSFAARRSFTGRNKTSASSPLIGPGSPTDEYAGSSPVTRKGPPAPLNLQPQATSVQTLPKSPEEYGPEDHTDSEYGDVELEELPGIERGRKKTREEDDREREVILLKEQESRSLSKKTKSAKASPHGELPPPKALPISPSIKGFAPTAPIASRADHLSPHASLAGILSGPPSSTGSIVERSITLSPPPMSPGLPISPRPSDRPPNSLILPRSPRDGFTSPPLSSPGPLSTQPLSPRPPRHPIPPPPHTPSTSSLSPPPNDRVVAEAARARSPVLSPPSVPLPNPPASVQQQSIPKQSTPRSPALQPPEPSQPSQSSHSTLPSKHATSDSSSSMRIDTSISRHRPTISEMSLGGVNKSLVSDSYPELLLPPNAIPLISIKVTSSRLKPSRNSVISPKGLDEEPVFTLGITQRSDMKQLWRVEKNIMSLPELDRHVKQACAFDIKLPDKSLFSGQSPAKIDARREALEKYFEIMFETDMNEKAGLVICHYLSSNIIPAETQEGMQAIGSAKPSASSINIGPNGKPVKEGYLTKRGKQFGGWKARFFVLDESILRYYDAPGGALQGTIRLTEAQIGRQMASQTPHSPARGDDLENQFRHAFLIMEPKRKDSKNTLKHVLCAESDHERDDWVYALLQYVGVPAPERKPATNRSNSESMEAHSRPVLKHEQKESPKGSDHSKPEVTEALQGTSYEDTAYAQPPTRMAPPPPPPQSMSPTKVAFRPGSSHSNQQHLISGPSNGSIIQDLSAWGHKAPSSPKSKEKEQKKRSIWGFRDKAAEVVANHGHIHHVGGNASHVPKTPLHPVQTVVRPVFGVPLEEAVQYCPPRGVNLPIPSVVYRCIEYLEAKGAANEEGIFRLSGSNVVIKQLKEKFNDDGDFDFLATDTYYDVHAVAGLLKLYLRELPNMVLTRDLHVEFLRYMELEDKRAKIAGYNVLVHRLPMANWTLVQSLSRFLIGIVNNSGVNKMSVRNVGIVFAPTLNMPAPVFAAFLTDYDSIFTNEPPSGDRVEPPEPSPLTPEDIRSPRRQVFSELPTPSYQQESFQRPTHHHHQEQTQHNQHTGGFGFVPFQPPSYETAALGLPSNPQLGNRHSVLIPGPEISSTPRTQGAGLGSTGMMRDAKARRRESAMMFTGHNAAHRKSSMPTIGNVTEE